MKFIKTSLLTVLFLAVVTISNHLIQDHSASAFASYRVRTVPSSDQKKKEPAPETETPKVQTKQASYQSSGFCNDAELVKTKLAVVNGGAPK